MGRLTGKSPAAACRFVLKAFALLALSLPTGRASADSWRLTVTGNGTELGETPVVAELKGSHSPGVYRVKSQGEGQGPAGVAQVFMQGNRSYFATVLKRVPARGELTSLIETDTGAASRGSGVEFRPQGSNLEVLVGGKPFTVYRTDEPTKPYFYPVIGPGGLEYTRAYPMKPDVAGETKDHPHQRSLWFTFGNVNGYDFWASDPINKPNPKFGTIHETSRKTVVEGPGVGILATTDDWLGPDGKRVCQDERVVRFYETTGARVMDFDVTIKANDGPVTFNDTKEGMFGLRVASSMDVVKGKTKQGGKITNAEGATDDAAWGKASPWVDYTGPVAGKTVGVAILNHPGSFRYPTTWHVRTYGLFAANPFGWHDFGMSKSGEYVVPRGQSIHFGYRVILHEGDTASAALSAAFKAYAEPPSITLQGD